MHLLLFVIGLALAAAGVAMLRFAVPIDDVVGAALFTSGTVALVGAVLMMALALTLRIIGRIFERLYIQPLPLPPLAALERDDPAPRAARPAEAPTGRAESGLRPSTLLGWLGSSPAPKTESPPESESPETSPASTPEVDLAALARIPEPPREPPMPSPPASPSLRPPTPATPAPAPSLSRSPQLPPLPTPVPPLKRAPPPPPPLSPPPIRSRTRSGGAAVKKAESEVYRSGVIDGMSYSLFMDGSIQAELPQGTVKFASVDELQRYLLITSPD